MSRGPYMNRPTRTWGPSSAAITSLARWLAVTFCKDRNQLLHKGLEGHGPANAFL